MLNERGAANQGTFLIIALLVAALIAVFVLWQRDSESKDIQIDIGQATPEAVTIYCA